MKELAPFQRLKEFIHYRRNLHALPDGNSLCYEGEPLSQHTAPFTSDSYAEGKEQEIVLFFPKKPEDKA